MGFISSIGVQVIAFGIIHSKRQCFFGRALAGLAGHNALLCFGVGGNLFFELSDGFRFVLAVRLFVECSTQHFQVALQTKLLASFIDARKTGDRCGFKRYVLPVVTFGFIADSLQRCLPAFFFKDFQSLGAFGINAGLQRIVFPLQSGTPYIAFAFHVAGDSGGGDFSESITRASKGAHHDAWHYAAPGVPDTMPVGCGVAGLLCLAL